MENWEGRKSPQITVDDSPDITVVVSHFQLPLERLYNFLSWNTEELNENNIYLLLNREKQEFYIGETKKSLSQRYPDGQKHHSFDDWTEYCIFQLPQETSEHTRLLIERILIATESKIFPNTLYIDKPVLDKTNGLTLKNKKK